MAKAVCACCELATRSGKPYSRIARAGETKGKRPPKVKAVAIKTAGICHGEKSENKPEAMLPALMDFVSVDAMVKSSLNIHTPRKLDKSNEEKNCKNCQIRQNIKASVYKDR
jgi:hypothetical protein